MQERSGEHDDLNAQHYRAATDGSMLQPAQNTWDIEHSLLVNHRELILAPVNACNVIRFNNNGSR